MSFSLSEYTKIDVGWGFAPDLTGELTALPQTSWLVSRGPLCGGGEWKGGKDYGRGEGKGGERGMGRVGKRGSWGNNALVVGDRRPCLHYLQKVAIGSSCFIFFSLATPLLLNKSAISQG